MKVFVTGASGFVGRSLVPALLKAGYQVYGHKGRENSSLGIEHPDLKVIWGDLAENSTFKEIEKFLNGVSAVVHMAAKTSQDTSAQNHSSWVNIDGTQRLLDLSKKAGVQKFVYVSTQSAKIKNPGTYGASKKKAEELVQASGINYIILRPAIIYGPGEAGIFKKFVTLVNKFPLLPIPHTSVKFRPVYVGDVVQAILNSLNIEGLKEKIYDIIGPDPVTFKELIRKVAEAKRLNRTLLPVPMGLAMMGAKILSIFMKKPPVTVDNLIGLSEAPEVDIRPMTQELKVQPLSLEEGILKSVSQSP